MTAAPMRWVETTDEVPAYVGQELGCSDWVRIDQPMIDAFARLTGDDSWIHTDPARAAVELPEGRTIVHGMLTFSLLVHLGGTLFNVRRRARAVNAGANRLRFVAPVLCGDRVRLRRSLKSAECFDGGVKVAYDNTMEIEGRDKPAFVAETLHVIYASRAASA